MSPLLTSANPYRKKDRLLKEDSCLKFKMQQNILRDMTNGVDNKNEENIKRRCSGIEKLQENEIKQLSRFGKRNSELNKNVGILTNYNR